MKDWDWLDNFIIVVFLVLYYFLKRNELSTN
jgi:hypothetical protein